MTKTIVAAALGECVHVAGVMNFLRLAEATGWRTVFLGPAVPAARVLERARAEQADMVAVSYRLTPENGERLLGEFAEAMDDLNSAGVRFAFGGTPAVAARARALGFFDAVFDGSQPVEAITAYLRGERYEEASEEDYPSGVIDRIRWRAPYPILRHHFGLPDLAATEAGIAQIAEARALDVISLGTDQDAQENYFHPERQDPGRRGAGGVPIRRTEDYAALYAASRRGNYPLMRSYSGTDDLLRLAEEQLNAIRNAWCAVSLFWFNQMDGRGPWGLRESIEQHQQLMAWHGARRVPVESNEAHHWGLRDAPDVIFCVSSYLAAYNARAAGVRDYIVPLMFNSPPNLAESMDLARMLATLDMVETLQGPDFSIWRQTRTGLLSYPQDLDAARAHLVASVYLQMALRPHIVHVVGYCEAQHAASADEVIESCRLASRAIENALHGQPDLTADAAVARRRAELAREASVTLEAIRALSGPGVKDAFTDPETLSLAVTSGILDAPHLRNNPFGRGEIVSGEDSRGAWVALDPRKGTPIGEAERLARLPLNRSKEGRS
ncbi:MAG: cobalamin B12-binding domain-containing protein [Chloroflexi bacterium]|nr:cobalamin B12-binding domain-containing protein [Chloroflexota bacterium]